MSAAELKELKNEMKKFIDGADERIVRKMYAVMEEEEDTNELCVGQSGLTIEQEAMIKARMEKHKKGLAKFSTLEEVEKRIILRAKNAI